METSELRRFNLVLFDGKMYQVFSVDPCFVGLSLPGEDELCDSVDVCRVEPVPLTDDLVNRCVQSTFLVKKDGDKFMAIDNHWEIVHAGDYFYLRCPNETVDFITRSFRYLHELQNIWHANIGQELQINL